MKIYSDTNREPVTECQLHLKSINMRFAHTMYPPHLQYPANLDSSMCLGRKNTAVIEFMDTREIDMLIGMLEQFKKENSYMFGAWGGI